MDPNRIKAWAAAIVAVGALYASGMKVVDVRAQEAAKQEAAAQVEQRISPIEKSIDETNAKLETLVEQGRRQEDRELLIICLDNKYQDLEADDRYDKCEEESVARWKAWAEEDAETDPEG